MVNDDSFMTKYQLHTYIKPFKFARLLLLFFLFNFKVEGGLLASEVCHRTRCENREYMVLITFQGLRGHLMPDCACPSKVFLAFR